MDMLKKKAQDQTVLETTHFRKHNRFVGNFYEHKTEDLIIEKKELEARVKDLGNQDPLVAGGHQPKNNIRNFKEMELIVIQKPHVFFTPKVIKDGYNLFSVFTPKPPPEEQS